LSTAEIVVAPSPKVVKRPLAFTDPAPGFEEDQDAELDRFAVVASEYVPVRVNCWVRLVPMEMFDGVRVAEVRTGAVTVKVAAALNAPDTAPIVATPWPAPVASPAGLIVATPGADELHCTNEVRSCVERSLRVPVALNCWVLPFGIDVLAGAIEIDCSTGAVTVRVVDPLTVPEAAVMLVAPWPRLAARPFGLIMAATPGTEDVHVAVVVRSWEVLLL
jgi:hypothetical protein